MFNLIKPDEQKHEEKLANANIDLFLGDSLELLKNIEDNSIDLIVTDPPYLIERINTGGTINNLKKLNKSLSELDNADIISGYDIETFGKEFIRVMKDINIYIWCNKVQIVDYFNFYVNQIGCVYDILFWNKPNALPTYSNKYIVDMEYCLYFRKGKGRCFPQNYEDAKTYYSAPINVYDKQKYKHPTIKPLEMTERFIRNSSREGEVVLDPFMGSGTTGAACKRLNRKFIGMEINEQFYNMAKMRIAETRKE